MKVRVNTHEEDYRTFLDIYVTETDKDRQVSFYDGESEDNSLGRNFNDCFSIADLMQAAFEAGKRGETFEIENTEIDEF